LVWIFITVDNILQPVISAIWGRTVPGVGFGVTMVLIYLVGLITSNFLGKKLLYFGEAVLARVPIVSWLYINIKQIIESLSAPGKTGFTRVVLVEFPRKGIKAIGFVTNELTDESGEKLLYIFVPTSPNPTSGFLQIAREEEVFRTDMSVDDALRMVISAGKASSSGVGGQVSASN
jgi:uncharacterized membrane protein